MPNVIADVTYQIHLPTSAGIGTPDNPGAADVYRRAAQEALVVYDGTDAGLATVITNNVTLNPGEVFDVLQVEPVPLGDKPIFQ
jgi:hypothetical protein